MFNINLTSDIFKNPQKICNLGGHFSSKEPCVDKCQIHILDTNFPLTSVSASDIFYPLISRAVAKTRRRPWTTELQDDQCLVWAKAKNL